MRCLSVQNCTPTLRGRLVHKLIQPGAAPQTHALLLCIPDYSDPSGALIPVEMGQDFTGSKRHRLLPGSVAGLVRGAMFSNGGTRRSLRESVRHALTESDLVSRDG